MQNPDECEHNPTLLLDETISNYQALYAGYGLDGFIQVAAWLDAHKQGIAIQPAVVHQDFHANNIFLYPNHRLFVIDWTQCGVSDVRIDLCWTLLIMGDLGNPAWKGPIYNAYASGFNDPAEHLGYFNAVVIMKLLASTVISRLFDPKELGLRPEKLSLTRRQCSIYRRIYQKLRNTTGLAIPELEDVLEKIER